MQQAVKHDTRTLEFTQGRNGDTLYAVADVLTLINDLVACRDSEGEIVLSLGGAAGLNQILGAAIWRLQGIADVDAAKSTQDRNATREEYQRGFGEGIAEGRRQMEEKHELLKRVRDIVGSLPSKDESTDANHASHAPEPRLTEPAAGDVGEDSLPATARA